MTKIRTRFAPSPTGYLHVGGLRTALFNYLFARLHGGTFVLRIEDTDQARFVEGAAEQLMASLKWAKLEYDEGPDKPGDHGPYHQSERLDLYKKYADQLVENGDAYPCFCSKELLDEMREAQQARGEETRYDGRCRNLDAGTVKDRIAQGEEYVVRLKMPRDGETVFEDIVRGTVTVQNERVDDQVLVKTDGFPTYHLANVVDDHLMEISHIIRGEEWLLSVPKHLRLYEALGWEAPQMAHLPLLLNEDRSKLSKRQGDVNVEQYRDRGFLQEALINFVALLGWNPGTDEELFSLEELTEKFSLERVNKAGSVFDVAKLQWMNGQYLRKMEPAVATEYVWHYLSEAGTADLPGDALRTKIATSVQSRIREGSDVPAAAAVFFSDDLKVSDAEALEQLKLPTSRSVFETFLKEAEGTEELNMDAFKQIMKSVQTTTGAKGPALWRPMRVALTGELAGPELPVVIEVFGKEKVCRFLKQALDKYV